MKKISKTGTNSIVYNNNYICIGGDKLEILERNTQKCIAKVSDVKNVLCMQMNEKFIFIKSTIGAYYIVDLAKATLIKKATFKGAKKTHQSKKFFLHTDFMIFDIMRLVDNKLYFILYDLESQTHSKIALVESGFYCQDYIIDFKQKKAIILLTKTNALSNQYTNCTLIVVDIQQMSIVEKRDVIFQHGLLPIGLVDSDTILLKNMELFSISTNQECDLALNNCFINNEDGYFIKLERISSSQVALIFSNKVIVYNKEQQKLEKEIKSNYCSSFRIIDGICYLGTWDGFFKCTQDNQGTVSVKT